MQNVCKKYYDQTSVNLMAPSLVSCPSRWNSSGSQVPRSSLSNARSLDVDSPRQHCFKVKQMAQQLQEQDSSSTQSTGQSHHETTSSEGENSHWNSGCNGTYKTRDVHLKSVLSLGNPNFVPAPQVDYGQSFARMPYPYPDPCFGGLVAHCGPQPVIHSPPMVGVVPTRVPLPLNLAQEDPIYVNAKQYRGIIRRREARAKLEAQNKLIKARKPYLHESRHLHALKRVRGSGGRFLNTKQLEQLQQQESRSTHPANGRNTLELAFPQHGENQSESEFQSETSEIGASTASCSEITDLSNNDYMLRHSDQMFLGYPPYMSASGTRRGH